MCIVLGRLGSTIDMVKYVFVSPVKRAVSTASFLGFPDPVPVYESHYLHGRRFRGD